MINENLPLYSTFLAVAKAGSILGAANQLYISQPAVTKSIKKLEQNLNTTLFIRTSRGVKLTEDGERLYSHINGAFENISAGESDILSRSALGVGHIKIGVSTTLCKHVLLPMLSLYTKKHPHINISIECQSSGDTVRLLQEGAIDIGLIAKNNASEHLNYIHAGYVHDIFIATPSYLDGMKARQGKANYLLLNKANLTRQYVDNNLPNDFYSENNILEIDNMNLLIDFAKAGIGIGCAIKEFVKEELSFNLLKTYKAGLPSLDKREVCFAYTSGRSLSTHMEDFVEFVKECVKDKEVNVLL